MQRGLGATLLEEIFKDAHGSSQSSITGQRGVQRRGPEDQPAHSSRAAHNDTEHKHPWGGDQAVACYENRAVEGIKGWRGRGPSPSLSLRFPLLKYASHSPAICRAASVLHGCKKKENQVWKTTRGGHD
ncbi:uncharacterized protein LOC143747331 isoform X2 [Siphateles boraxobius]|uniref:uncharacterized protein LOC143747331 isoform X2 n=1 Tax=Siphateles boraxobius TaxID=180520 RepID=UPI004063C174